MTRNLGFVAASRGHRFRRWLAGLVAVASTVTIANLELAHPRPDARTGSANDVAFPSPSEAGAAAAAVPDTTLRTLAAARGLRVGTAVHATPLANEAAYRDKVAQEFNSVTAEVNNELTGFTDNLQRVTGLGSDRHFQLVANHSRRCVDVVARSMANGARIQQSGCHANPTTYRNQVFRLPNAPGGHP
jgi:hypothetical protein